MKLIIINGPCGVGKSTLSAKLHDNLPLSFHLDIDSQRRFISHYRELREKSGKISKTVALAIINSCLEIGCDIIIDKMIYDAIFLDSFYQIANNHGADVHEFILWAPKKIVMKRAEERGWRKGGLLTPEKCEIFWQKINELKKTRPKAHIINIESIEKDALFDRISKIVDNVTLDI